MLVKNNGILNFQFSHFYNRQKYFMQAKMNAKLKKNQNMHAFFKCYLFFVSNKYSEYFVENFQIFCMVVLFIYLIISIWEYKYVKCEFVIKIAIFLTDFSMSNWVNHLFEISLKSHSQSHAWCFFRTIPCHQYDKCYSMWFELFILWTFFKNIGFTFSRQK